MDHPIRELINAAEAYLDRFDHGGARHVVAGIGQWKAGALRGVPAQPAPACGFLDESIAAIHGADALKQAIGAARPHLDWIAYDLYPRAAIGERFPAAHAFTSIIGGGGPVWADDFELGLFLIAPRTLYRDHHHAAPELYVPLTGPHHWRFGPDAVWQEKPAGDPVWNDP